MLETILVTIEVALSNFYRGEVERMIREVRAVNIPSLEVELQLADLRVHSEIWRALLNTDYSRCDVKAIEM